MQMRVIQMFVQLMMDPMPQAKPRPHITIIVFLEMSVWYYGYIKALNVMI